MLKNFVSRKYYCGFDLGSLSVKAALIKDLDNQPAELLGVYEMKTAGFKNGALTDLSELAECVHLTIGGLLGKTGIKLKEIYLGVGGEMLQKHYSSALIPLLERGSKVISTNDLRKVKEQAKILGAGIEEDVLHNIAQYYKVDDVKTALNPIGLYGRKIEINTLLLLVKHIQMQNLVKAVNQAGFDVANIFYTSYTSSQACLSEYHRRQGCVLVDVGAIMTDILIFHDGFLKYVVNIPLGGEHLTQSIANRLDIPFELAEDIKKSYAFALSSQGHSDEEILIKNSDGYTPIKKEIIAQALEPAVARFVDLVLQAIKNSNLENEIKAGMVMIGGGSLLPGLEERIEQAAKMPVKVGKINITTKRLPYAAKYCAAVGLALSGLSYARGRLAAEEGNLSLKQKISNKVVELYQEYF